MSGESLYIAALLYALGEVLLDNLAQRPWLTWFVWATSRDLAEAARKHICGTRKLWIPPCKNRLTKPDDAARFGKIREGLA